MYSELLRIPLQWHGVPIFGFGVVLAGWLLFSAWAVPTMAKVEGWPAALRAHLPTVLMVAALIALIIPRFFSDGVPIRGYGVMVLAGSVAGIWMSIRRAKQAGLAPEEIMGLAVAMFIAGIVGARLFYVVEYWDARIRQPSWTATLKAALSFTEGGLVIYGAFIGAMVGFVWYVMRRRLPALAVCDMIAPGMIVGLSLGRIGCLLNGCCYGGECTAPWAITFPRESVRGGTSEDGTLSPPYLDQAASGRFYGFRIGAATGDAQPAITQIEDGSPAAASGLQAGEKVSEINGHAVASVEEAQALILTALRQDESLAIRTAAGEVRTIAAIDPPARTLPVHPAQVYSSIDAALLAWVMWSFYPYRRRDGEVTALMITLHPISRFLLEMIRVDEPAVFGTRLSISQNLSLVLLALGVGLWLWLARQPKGRLAFFDAEPAVANRAAR